MRLFDRYVVVDWSAASTPRTGHDSIWIADLVEGSEPLLLNPPTRRHAAQHIADLLAGADDRILIGFDASFGYPAGSAALFGLEGVPWRSMWATIAERSSDGDRNRNNRFAVAADLNGLAGAAEGPFWGCPRDRFAGALRPTKPPTFPVDEFRLVERRLRAAGRYPKSCWQLLGAGSVGSQTLTLLPILHALLDQVAVWPLTTGLTMPDGSTRVTVAEVWPTMFVQTTPIGTVRDAAQVSGTAVALRAADRSGELRDWFAPSCTTQDRRAVESEEGWILGPVPP